MEWPEGRVGTVSYTHRMRFRDRLGRGTVVFDGAMGTMLYGRGVFVNRCFDELNLSNPNLVRQVHAEYLEAGAEVIETNTFGAHRFKLGPHGLEAQVRKINREGRASPARRRARRASWRARSGRSASRSSRSEASGRTRRRGGLPRAGRGAPRRRRRRVRDRDDAVARPGEGGARGRALARLASCPSAVSLTFNEEGNTLYGDSPEDAVRELEALGVPLVGANCSQGPQAMLETLSADGRGRALGEARRRCPTPARPRTWTAATSTSARPSTWRPGRAASWRRARASSAAAAARRPRTSATWSARCGCSSRAATVEVKVLTPPRRKEAPAPVPREAEVAARAQRCGRKFVVSVELDPPRGADAGADHRARAVLQGERGRRDQRRRRPARLGAHERPGAVRAAAGEGGDRHDPALHLPRPEPARDPVRPARGPRARPPQRARDHGDPPKLGDYPDATAVYDVDSIGLDPHHGQPQPRRGPGGQPDGPVARDPRGLRRRPEQARHGEGGPAARGEGEGRRRVHHDAARLRPAHRSSASCR